jgi:hypothetical protein
MTGPGDRRRPDRRGPNKDGRLEMFGTNAGDDIYRRAQASALEQRAGQPG